MALVENFAVTGTKACLDKALDFLDVTITFQLESGMRADYHYSMAALSLGVIHVPVDVTQGFSLKALGTILECYY